MKLNINTTQSGTNTPLINVQDTLWAMAQETWALENLAHIGKTAAFNEVEPASLAHQFETLETRLEALHEGLHNLLNTAVFEAKLEKAVALASCTTEGVTP